MLQQVPYLQQHRAAGHDNHNKEGLEDNISTSAGRIKFVLIFLSTGRSPPQRKTGPAKEPAQRPKDGHAPRLMIDHEVTRFALLARVRFHVKKLAARKLVAMLMQE